jgi:hypothetical protein
MRILESYIDGFKKRKSISILNLIHILSLRKKTYAFIEKHAITVLYTEQDGTTLNTWVFSNTGIIQRTSNIAET